LNPRTCSVQPTVIAFPCIFRTLLKKRDCPTRNLAILSPLIFFDVVLISRTVCGSILLLKVTVTPHPLRNFHLSLPCPDQEWHFSDELLNARMRTLSSNSPPLLALIFLKFITIQFEFLSPRFPPRTHPNSFSLCVGCAWVCLEMYRFSYSIGVLLEC